MKLDHDFFNVSKLTEDQKKGLHQKLKSVCPRINLNEDQKNKKGLIRKQQGFCPRNYVKTKKGPNIIQCSDADHSQINGGDTVKLLGGIYPPSPYRVSAPVLKSMQNTTFLPLLRPIFALKTKIVSPLAMAMRIGKGPEIISTGKTVFQPG